jgi:hypothetical protein
MAEDLRKNESCHLCKILLKIEFKKLIIIN